MLIAYSKIHRGKIYIYEKGETYVGMELINVNRQFKGLDNKPLTFELDQQKIASEFCHARNEIMNIGLI